MYDDRRADARATTNDATPRRRRSRVVLVVVLTLALVAGGVTASQASPSLLEPILGRTAGHDVDSDHDGLSDREEADGWPTEAGDVHRTDPAAPDTAGAGLLDGLEAGARVGLDDGVAVYAGWTVPTTADTDDDGVGDGDELFLDMDPTAADTDDDGLDDAEELDLGSDPTERNADGDAYSDATELERETNPLSYDLSIEERAAAAAAGFTFGDCDECALDSGLRVAQVESAEYLVGQYVSEFMPGSGYRDIALDLWKGEFLEAGMDALGLIPGLRVSGRVARQMLVKFGLRSSRARRVVLDVVEQLPLVGSIVAEVLADLPERAGALPDELDGGPADYVVSGDDFVAITADPDLRTSQHAAAGPAYAPRPLPGATGLTRGEARAIAQACVEKAGGADAGVLRNGINIVSPRRGYQKDAVEFGDRWLEVHDAVCPGA